MTSDMETDACYGNQLIIKGKSDRNEKILTGKSLKKNNQDWRQKSMGSAVKTQKITEKKNLLIQETPWLHSFQPQLNVESWEK